MTEATKDLNKAETVKATEAKRIVEKINSEVVAIRERNEVTVAQAKADEAAAMKKDAEKDEEETYSGIIVGIIEAIKEIEGEEQYDREGDATNSVNFKVNNDEKEQTDGIATNKEEKGRRREGCLRK